VRNDFRMMHGGHDAEDEHYTGDELYDTTIVDKSREEKNPG
jgi:hypothetical protein